MANAMDLQEFLEELLGSRNVYFDPPENVRMNYPAIRYSRRRIANKHANNTVYKQDNCYEVVAIYRNPDDELPMKISRLPMCTSDGHYVADNLHHDRFTLYY